MQAILTPAGREGVVVVKAQEAGMIVAKADHAVEEIRINLQE